MTNKNKTAKFSLKKSLFLASISLLSVAPALVAISCKDPKKEEKGVKYESFINPDLNNSAVLEKFEKYNQIHILSEIKEYFDKVDTSELFIFKNGAKPENIPFNNMMKNNFLIKNAEFNEKKFKEIVKKQFKLSDKFIERFKFKIDYNNTYFDPGNYFDVLIPVDVKLYLENHNKAEYHKGMFINQPIKLRIKNVKNQEIEKNTEFKEVYKKINELKDEDFKINVNDFESKKETLELIEKWGINELNSEQIASIFDLKNEKFDAIKQSAEQGKKLSLKMTAFGVDFYDKE